VSINRHSLKRSTLAAGAATTLAVMTACSTSTDSGSESSPEESSEAMESEAPATDLPQTIVFSPLSLEIPAMQGLADGVTGYGEAHEWEVIVQDPKFDPSTQVQQAKEVLESGRAGAMWIIAVAPESMTEVLATGQELGVPILINGVPADYGFDGPQVGVSFGTIDYVEAGSALGEQTGMCINDKLGGEGTVIYGESAAGTAGKEEIDTAFMEALAATAPGAEVVQSWEAVERAQSQTDVGTILQGNPDVNVVASSNDEGILGAIGAFKAAGTDLPCAVDFGGNDEVLGLVEDGTMYATAALQFEEDMIQSFDTLAEMQLDPTMVGPELTVPLKVTTSAG